MSNEAMKEQVDEGSGCLSWRRAEGIQTPLAETQFPKLVKAGEERVVILRTDKGYRGVELRCPHLQHSMTLGIMMGAGTMVRCPKHNFIFRLSDGKGVNCVGLNLKVYDVRESQGGLDVLVATSS